MRFDTPQTLHVSGRTGDSAPGFPPVANYIRRDQGQGKHGLGRSAVVYLQALEYSSTLSTATVQFDTLQCVGRAFLRTHRCFAASVQLFVERVNVRLVCLCPLLPQPGFVLGGFELLGQNSLTLAVETKLVLRRTAVGNWCERKATTRTNRKANMTKPVDHERSDRIRRASIL